jgi:carboxylesterase type B
MLCVLVWFGFICFQGGFLIEQPLTALAGGRMHPVPLVSGSVLDEGQMFVYELFTSPLSKVAYEITLLGIFGREMGKQLTKLYPFDTVPGSEDGRTALNYLATDLMFYCPLRNATRGYRAALGAEAVPTYEYRFDHVMSFDCWGEEYAFCVGYVCHGSELAFEYNVFGDGEDVTYDPDADELQLTIDVSDMWSNFIASGNPNTGLSTPHAWPLYGSKDELLALNEPVTALKTHQREKYCDFWDKYGYYY